jgi:hypothetical protein
MMKIRPVTFAEFRALLEELGFRLKRTKEGEIFHHPSDGLKLFRRYKDNEFVDPVDVLSTRKLLDLRGMLEEADFDKILLRTNKPA